MQNGNDFHVFIQETSQFLSTLTVTSYYGTELPDAVDERMKGIVARYMAAKEAQWPQFRDGLAQEQRSLFGIYGHRAATMPVREADKDPLLSGLVGAAIANYTIPKGRSLDVSLAVYYHCAQKLDVNTVDLFDEAAQVASADAAPILAHYGRRSDVTLRKYGWREIKTPEGVAYRFNL